MIHIHRIYETVYGEGGLESTRDERIREYTHDHDLGTRRKAKLVYHNHLLDFPLQTPSEMMSLVNDGYHWCYACREWYDDTRCYPGDHSEHCGHPLLTTDANCVEYCVQP